MQDQKTKIEKPFIGKNVIEILTMGMYENPFFIFREYVQNAADQIDVAVEEEILDSKDDGVINIDLNKEKRTIKIRDNATGIKSKEVIKQLTNIAASEKDPNFRKGFRGIGRLGGLGYCDNLVFRTSYEGEMVETTLTFDAKELKRLIRDQNVKIDAATLISIITSVSGKEAAKNEHYFEVELVNIQKESDDLLDHEKVHEYLCMVAPVPFSEDFDFKDKISQGMLDKGLSIEEYDVKLNLDNKRLYKAYQNELFDKEKNVIAEILDVYFIQILSPTKEILGLGWYGINNLNFVMHNNNLARGIRIRKNNIQIGDQYSCNQFFKEGRFNHYYIGEIHILGDSFTPNARRDYFNESKSVTEFENELKEEFKNLSRLSRDSSEIRNKVKVISEYNTEFEDFNSRTFRNAKERSTYQKQLEESKEKAEKAISKIESFFTKAEDNSALAKILNEHTKGIELLAKAPTTVKIEEYQPLKFSKLDSKQEKLVLEIFDVIESNLSKKDAETIKQILIDLYN